MGDFPEGVFSILADAVNKLIENGELSSWHIVLASMVMVFFWKIRSVISFVKGFIDGGLVELNRLAKNKHLESSDIDNISFSIRNVIRYRVTGIKDVERQCIVNSLLSSNRHLIAPDFFKKFRNYLVAKEGELIFIKKWAFYFECNFYRLFMIQYLMVAIFMGGISFYRGNEINIYAHIILWVMVGLSLVMLHVFSKMLPTKKECKLLEQILKKQSDDAEFVDSFNFRHWFRCVTSGHQ